MPRVNGEVITHKEIGGISIIDPQLRLVLVRVPDLKSSGRKGSGIHDLVIMDPIEPLWKNLAILERMIPEHSRYGLSEELTRYLSKIPAEFSWV